MIAIPPTQYRLFGNNNDEVQATDLFKSLMNSSLKKGSWLKTSGKSFLIFYKSFIWSIAGAASLNSGGSSSDIAKVFQGIYEG